MPKRSVPLPSPLKFIAAARKRYQRDGEVQIDDNAAVSLCEGGVWVEAWMWVDTNDLSTRS